MANSCYSRYYFPLISGSTTIGASLIVFVKASLDILSLHIPDEPYDNYSCYIENGIITIEKKMITDIESATFEI